MKVSAENVASMFLLPCVESIRKTERDTDICVRVRREWNGARWLCTRAYSGDMIVCENAASKTAAVEVESIKAVIRERRTGV